MNKPFRLYRFHVFILFACFALYGPIAAAAPPDVPAGAFIDQVVHNELADRGRPDVWLYHVEHTQSGQTESRLQADTKFGPIYRVLARGGVPLTPEEQHAEDSRINSLLSNGSLQAKNRQQHIDDERHLENLMTLMPQAFLYEYDGENGGQVRIKFKPNPNFDPPTYEGRVFHGLTGSILVDEGEKRIAVMKGMLEQPVEFGYGILGKLEKGGTFEFHRTHVTGERWKTSFVELHIIGHIVLFKTIAKDQKEVRSDFDELPPETTLRQARDLLYK